MKYFTTHNIYESKYRNGFVVYFGGNAELTQILGNIKELTCVILQTSNIHRIKLYLLANLYNQVFCLLVWLVEISSSTMRHTEVINVISIPYEVKLLMFYLIDRIFYCVDDK